MRFFSIIPITVFILLGRHFSEQEQTKIPAGIAIAFKAGNAAELAKYMNPTVELHLLDKEDFYKKNAAEVIMKDFFNSYPTKDFTVLFQGAKNDLQYEIGTLKTERGNFRVYFLLKKVDKELLIQQIRIEAENGK